MIRGAALLALAAGAAMALTPVDETAFDRLVKSNRGKVTLYDFWATWCEPCRAELPRLARLELKLRSRGFRLVTISADEPEQDAEAGKLLEKMGIAGPRYRKQAASDEGFINAIDRKWSGALPALFLYDRGGRKARSFIGEPDQRALEAAVQKLLQE